MSLPVGVSARSFVIAGMSAAVVGAAVVTPVSAPALNPRLASAVFQTTSITSPLENAIKNTYNAVEPWVAYGVSWADYILGFIPVVNWFTPIIPLTYNTIEPLVQAGTYAFADVVGLNFAQIWPDIVTGVDTSINNFITGILNWANIPLPPPWPGAAVAPTAASETELSADLASVTAVEADTAADTATAEAQTPAETPVVDAATGDAVPAAEMAVSSVVDAVSVPAPPATETPAAIGAEVSAATVADEAPEAAAPQPTRLAQRGQRTPVADKAGATSADSGPSGKAAGSGRASRSAG